MASRPVIFPVGIMLILVAVIIVFSGTTGPAYPLTQLKGADTAWMLTSSALVLVMTPGLAFFYGGMVNKKNVISTMLQSFICMVVITIVWVVAGFSLVFGDSIIGLFGNPR